MKRREFITLLGGAAMAGPIAARAQQAERMRRIGMLLPAITNDDAFQDRIGAFLQGLQEAGWSIGRNVRIETRWASNNPTEIRSHAAELAALAPDVVVAFAASTVGAMLQATSSVPIVFPGVADPVAAGFVDSLARPGRNATGFLLFEYGMAGKLLELLKEIAPGVLRAGVLRDPATASGPAQFGVIQAAAPSLRVEVSLINMRDPPEIEQAVAAFAHSSNNGLIVPASGSAAVHRMLIIMLAARHRLPVIYGSRAYVTSGGLASYGPDYVDQFRRSASYVDRILKGEKPADLPVQAPTKYELVINLKTAKALGLIVPQTVLAGDDVNKREVQNETSSPSISAYGGRCRCAARSFSHRECTGLSDQTDPLDHRLSGRRRRRHGCPYRGAVAVEAARSTRHHRKPVGRFDQHCGPGGGQLAA